MSDFDKEAEREKLREKYERDKAEREATQRMSDLLLKGATMTNTHCGTCGDPLFQQDGTTFCPSCHGTPDAVEGTDLEAQPAEEPGADDAQEGAAAGSTPADAADESHSADDAPDRSEPPTAAGKSSAEETTRQFESIDGNESIDAEGATRSPPSPPTRDDRSNPSAASPSGDLETAHDSLVAALEKFAAEAADTDDPRHAKACLEAAREASEAIDALR